MNPPQFVDVHGRPIKVQICGCNENESSKLLIPLEEIQKTGFVIFRKNQYNKLLIDEEQLKKEFQLHLLGCAKNYLLQNQIIFKEQEILEVINNVEKNLINNHSLGTTSNFLQQRQIQAISDIGSFQITTKSNNVTPNNHSTLLTTQNVKTHNIKSLRSFEEFHSPANSSVKSMEEEISVKNETFPQNNINNSIDKNYKNEVGNFCENTLNGTTTYLSENNNISNTSASTSLKQDMNINYNNNINKQNGFKIKYECNKELLISLEENSTYEGMITYLDMNREKKDSFLGFVQLKQNKNIMDDINKTLNSKSLNIIKDPEVNMLCCAEFDKGLSRVEVINYNPLKVYFVDYGRKAIVTEVRELPENLKKVPYQAIRFSAFYNGYDPKINDYIKFIVRNFYADSNTYCIKLTSLQSFTQRPEKKEMIKSPPIAFREPKNTLNEFKQSTKQVASNHLEKEVQNIVISKLDPSSQLNHNEMILVYGEKDSRFIVRNKNQYKEFVTINQEIKNDEYIYSTLKCPERGTLALYPKNNSLARVYINDIQDNKADITFLDYFDSLLVPLNELKTLCGQVAFRPAIITYILTPKLSNFSNKQFSEKQKSFIQNIIDTRTKLIINYVENVFDLEYENGELLSKKLIDLETPLVVKSPTQPKVAETKFIETAKLNKSFLKGAPNRVMLDDMNFCSPNLGVGKYVCYSFIDLDNITLIQEQKLFEFMSQIVVTDINDPIPYEPIVSEICMGVYGDGEWYRCAIMSTNASSYYCHFIDFGNIEEIQIDGIRKLPKALAEIPILGIKGRFIDVSVKELEMIKNLIEEGSEQEVEIIKLNNGVYDIKMPEIYKQIK